MKIYEELDNSILASVTEILLFYKPRVLQLQNA
jgi:hypothetical protein